ncbi:integrase core domain-containing protein [bacterium]|nr:integrase core domain-containing protein [bacterium]
MICDRDGIYGKKLSGVLKDFEIDELVTSYKSPWQNPYCERVIGSIRRECLNHLIVFNEKHLIKMLKICISYYNKNRPHQSLNGDSPDFREKQNISDGKIVSIPILNGLHHYYKRVA